MGRLPWVDMDVQLTSMLGLLQAKKIDAASSFGEKFTLVIGVSRHGYRVIFISPRGYYARSFDNEREAELMATEFAFALEEAPSYKLMDKFEMQKIG